jgi:hypothetical protein
MLKVPTKSMWITVLKAFVDKSSAAHRKLPAAPFTRMSSYNN